MKLRFLGTGTSQGVPVIGCHCAVCRSADAHDARLRTSALLTIEAEDLDIRAHECPDNQSADDSNNQAVKQSNNSINILFDIGPDFRQQALRAGLERVDAILVTHAHRDHVAGLDDIRALNFVQGSSMHLYLNAEARKALERDYHYIFGPHDYPGLPEAELHTVDGTAPFRAAGVEVTPIRAMHKNLPILGFRIGPMAYITDANHIDDAELEKLRGVEVLVLNALRQTHHFSHYSLPEAVQVVQRLGVPRVYLTHISHDMGFDAEVNASLPAHIRLAHDGLEVEI